MWEGELAGDDVDAVGILERFCAGLSIAPVSSVRASCVDFGGDFDRAEAGDAITRVRNEEAEEATGVIVALSQACYSGLSVSEQTSEHREMDFEHSKGANRPCRASAGFLRFDRVAIIPQTPRAKRTEAEARIRAMDGLTAAQMGQCACHMAQSELVQIHTISARSGATRFTATLHYGRSDVYGDTWISNRTKHSPPLWLTGLQILHE